MTTFIDTNVVIYLLEPDSEFHDWSFEEVTKAKEKGPVILPDIAYAELSIGMDSKEATDEALAELAFDRLPCSDASLLRAGRAFLKYRDQNKGTKNRVLPDFLIGAQAEAMGAPLLTANRGDFLKYFSKIELICPTTA
jgi:predicted nucleic acid-binding protein